MKHFLLGSVLGATAGLIFSCMKDDKGNRPGKPLKVEFDGLKHDTQSFARALKKTKQASQELNAQMPEAQRTISDMGNDIEKYSRHIQPTVDRLKQKGEEMNQDLENLAPDNKKA